MAFSSSLDSIGPVILGGRALDPCDFFEWCLIRVELYTVRSEKTGTEAQ